MSIKARVDRAEAEAGVGPFDLSVLSDEELLRLHDLLSRPDRSAEEEAEAERIAAKCRT